MPANALPPAMAAAEAEDTAGTGIQIAHTGAPGYLLANWFSVDKARDLVIETPFQGPAPNSHGGGNNPLTLEGDASSILFVKNTGSEPAVLLANFRYHGGEYTVGLRDLGPGETYTLDFRKLRDLQVPDDHGRLLPLEVEHGQVYWRRYSGPPLIGRTHLLSRSRRWADSMSCQPCNCHPADVWMGVSPGSWNKLIGESQPHSATKYENGCYGFMGYSFSPGSWSSGNPPAIPVSGSGTASCASPANANITGHDWAIVYFSSGPYGGCEVYDYPIAANAAGACLQVTQSPGLVLMSTGDTKEISVSVDPSTVAANRSFSGLSHTSNPNSSCGAVLSIPNASGSGTLQHDITASPAGCSGIFSIRASANGTQSQNPTTVRIPPQVLIQMLWGEARGQIGVADSSQPSIGVAARNRINNADFPGSTTYQNTITAAQFYGVGEAVAITYGHLPELTNAVGVYTEATGEIVENATCFWSPTAAQWANIQAALQSGTTEFPANVGAAGCYVGVPRQILVKTSVAQNNSGGIYQGAPAFVFLQRRNASAPAVRQIP